MGGFLNFVDILGFAAAALVLLTFGMKTMLPLRLFAIASNVLFASYGFLANIYPVMLLHLALLPLNVMRLVQLRRLIANIRFVSGRRDIGGAAASLHDDPFPGAE